MRDPTNNDEPAYIVNMVKGKEHWLLADGKGKIWKMRMDNLEVSEIMHFHSGPIADLVVCQKQNASLTVGGDGQVKLWDFIKDKEYYSRRFIGKGTCMDLL